VTINTRVVLRLATIFALLNWVSLSEACILNVTGEDSRSGALADLIATGNWDGDNGTLSIQGSQLGHSGQVLGAVVTDSELDPTLTLSGAMDNDTDFAWTGYQVIIKANKSFDLSNAEVYMLEDWSVDVSSVVPEGDVWVGKVDYSGGSPVAVGDTLEFSYKITFLGGIRYCQTFTPIDTADVPEPSTFALLGVGALGLLAYAWRRRRLAA
jgi:hypothetical protein